MHHERDQVYDHSLQDAAESGGDRFAKNQRNSPGGTHQQFMHHAKVALPDDSDAIEDRAEQDALCKDSGRDERKIAQLPGMDAANLGENLSEHHQPQHRLHRAGDDFGRIADEFDQFYFNNRGTLAEESFHLLFQFIKNSMYVGAGHAREKMFAGMARSYGCPAKSFSDIRQKFYAHRKEPLSRGDEQSGESGRPR